MDYQDISIDWLGHDGFRIKTKEFLIYIDPFKISEGEKADLILITHSHYDHCSKEDLKKIADKNTIILGPADCQSKLSSLDIRGLTRLEPNKKIKKDSLTIEAIPAYNTDKPFHPKDNNWLGYVIDTGNTRIYHAGDTDLIPEMFQLNNINIALLPVSGKYVMTAEQAAKAAKKINAEINIPMHYGEIVGSKEDAEKFKNLCENVRILEKC